MKQTDIFDYIEGQKLRDIGMMISASSCPSWLERARSIAICLARLHGEVTINDVYEKVGLPPNPNAAGSVFERKKFRAVGIDQSVRKERHAGIIRRWALK